MTRPIIGALFDDGSGSWNQLNKKNIYSVGINKNNGNNYFQIDLSIQNDNLLRDLKKLPKPDVIIASPPCESGSIANNQQRIFRKQTKNNIEVFTKEDNFKNNLKYKKQLKREYFNLGKTTLNGLSTTFGLFKIIETFKPSIWIIENPQTSKIGEFIRENKLVDGGYENITYYNCGDRNFTKKPTKFFSNIDLKLHKFKVKSTGNLRDVNCYDKRSSIPKELLQHIYERVKND